MSARDEIMRALHSRDGHALKHTHGELSDAILSALRSAGWAVVPVEPTEGMVADGALQALTTERHAQRVWEVMLKAAQEDSRE